MLIEFLVSALVKCFADLFHKLVVEIEVMKHGKSHSKAFLCLEKVTDIGTAVKAASRALTIGVDGSVVLGKSFVEKIDLALPSEKVAVACITAGHYTVEEINASADRLDDVEGSADAHKVSRLILGHIGLYRVNDAVHILGCLANGKTSDCVAVEIKCGDLLHILDTKILICATLIDSEKELMGVDGIGERIQTSHFLLASYKPTNGTLCGLLDVFVGCGVFNAFIKRHCDGRAEMRLNLHTLLGSHKDALAVNVGSEFDAFLGDLAKLREREDLKSAAIGKDGAAPIHKLVKSAHFIDELISGTDVKVVSVGKLDLATHFSEVFGRNTSLYCGAGADVHKYRGLDITVNGVEDASTGFAFLFQKLVHFNSS